MIALLVLSFLLLAAAEGRPLVRERLWRELAVFLVLWAVALAWSLEQALGLTALNPTDGIIWVLERLLHLSK
ncbi:MAG: hypothetical protein QJR13_00670 [Bacillota bacterium]|nr:hypothetical protein [Bacillota bacterium]